MNPAKDYYWEIGQGKRALPDERGGDNNNKSLTMQFRLDLFSEFPIPVDKDPDPTSE